MDTLVAPGTEPAERLSPDPAGPTRVRREWAWLLLVVVALTLATRVPAFFVDVFNSDETYLATQAEVLRDGGDLYREAADRKPPLVPYVYALTFEVFGTNELWTVRLVAMGALVATAMMLAVEARRRYGRRAAWVAALLCVLAMVAFAPQDGQAANFEIFMMPAMTAAVLLARRGHAGASGVAVAVATLAKQTGAATLLPVLYLVGRMRGRRGVSRAMAAFAIPLALVALAMGPAQLVYWTVLGNGSYVSTQVASLEVLSSLVLLSTPWLVSNLPIVWHVRAAWRERARRSAWGTTDWDLWLWLASSALSVMVGLRFFGHYYIQLVPPLCLLTASVLSRRPRRVAQGTVVFAALCAVGFTITGFFIRPYGQPERYETVSTYVARRTSADDRILVWGSVPEIYWGADRRPATRFPTTLTFLANNNPGRDAADSAPERSDTQAWEWFFEDLATHPPEYIIDTSPAAVRGAEWTPMSRFPTLSEFVATNYRYERSIDRMVIYRLVESAPEIPVVS